MTEPRRRNWVCPKGHEYGKVGVYRNGMCKACQQARQRLNARKRAGIIGATDEARSGPCDICGQKRRLAMDHDHASGERRGWLCHECNGRLGVIENTDWFAKAELYVKTHQKRTI